MCEGNSSGMMGNLSPVKKRKLLLPGLKPGSCEFIANVAALMADLFAPVKYTDHLMAC